MITNTLIPEMKQLHLYDTYIQRLRLDLATTFADVYGDRFAISRGSDAVFNNDGFVAMIVDCQKVRKEVRRARVTTGDTMPEPDASRCSVM